MKCANKETNYVFIWSDMTLGATIIFYYMRNWRITWVCKLMISIETYVLVGIQFELLQSDMRFGLEFWDWPASVTSHIWFEIMSGNECVPYVVGGAVFSWDILSLGDFYLS